MKHRFRPALDALEGRSLLAAVVEVLIDTGLTTPVPGVTQVNYDFGAGDGGGGGPAVPTSSHGSLMATIQAEAEAKLGITGNTHIMLKADTNGVYSAFGIAHAITYTSTTIRNQYPHKPIVVNLSMGGPIDFLSALPIVQSITKAQRHGIVFGAAAGNDSNNIDDVETFPAGAARYSSNVLVAAVTTDQGHLRPYSNFGPRTVQVAVPNLYGTSGAAALASVALASEMGSHPQHGRSGAAYSKAIVRTVARSAVMTPDLTGMVTYGLLENLAPRGHLGIRPTDYQDVPGPDADAPPPEDDPLDPPGEPEDPPPGETEPEPPDAEDGNPPGVPLPPIPIGPRGPAE